MSCQAWPVAWPRDIDPGDLDPVLVAAATEGAGNLLWALTGRVYGICTAVEGYRPACPPFHGYYRPYKDSVGLWHNVSGAAGCCRLVLTGQPVRSVEQVLIGGAVASDWFRQGNALVRQGACWPAGADCDAAPVEVHYTYGAGFPAGAELAVGELATELLNPLRGRECRLPSTVTAVVRNGVTISRLDVASIANAGLTVTGLPITDMLVRTLNPGAVAQPARVWRLDGARRVS